MESLSNYPHITVNNHGVPCIDGTRHKIVDIATDHIAHGYSAGQIVEQYPDLTLAQVHAALTYYYDHQEEIDKALMDSYEHTKKLRKSQKPHPKIIAALAEQVV